MVTIVMVGYLKMIVRSRGEVSEDDDCLGRVELPKTA